MLRTAAYLSPLGELVLASDGETLTGLWFVGQRHFPARLPSAGELSALPVFAQTARWLDLYFAGVRPDFVPALSPRGRRSSGRCGTGCARSPTAGP